jgi:hypothetical protein
MQLIPVTKDGEYLEVHPVALVAHKALGWAECERVADTNADGKVTAAELKTALTDAGVKFDARLSKDKLAALWAAFQRWGMTADEWNNLADEDKAARMANVGAD